MRVLVCVVLLAASLINAGNAGASERPVIGPAQGDSLHVMSFNLRYGSPSGANSWSARRPIMAELLRREQPTVIGTQEGLFAQLKDIERDLPARYDWIGVGRAGGSEDEFTAVFYDGLRVDALGFDHFWLSSTPTEVGSKSWGNKVIRMVTWVRFADRVTGRQFVFVNTHFDHESENSRVRSAEMVRDRINAIAPGLPVVLTGDFNAAPAAPTHHILTRGAGLTDSWLAAEERRTPLYATFHGYRPLVPNGSRIDWILTRGVTALLAAAINTFQRGGRLPSDHLPVQALIRL